jgi:hypothetical protein
MLVMISYRTGCGARSAAMRYEMRVRKKIALAFER